MDYTPGQIAVSKNAKKLVEFIDRLAKAAVKNYGHIHAQGDDMGNDYKAYSLIRIAITDYSEGTGEKKKYAYHNISPEEAGYIYENVRQKNTAFNFLREKIIGDADPKTGRCRVSKLKIYYDDRIDQSGKPRNYPWTILIENGTGIPEAVGNNGARRCKKGSYVQEQKLFMVLDQFDMYSKILDVIRYIQIWEYTYCPGLIREGKQFLLQEKIRKEQEIGIAVF